MNLYANHGGNAGVIAYKAGADFIDIQFVDGSVYRYNYERTGAINVDQMKKLAASGEGLTTFINKYVRDKFDRKLR